MFGEHISGRASVVMPRSHALAWQGAGEEWHGVLTHCRWWTSALPRCRGPSSRSIAAATFFARSQQVWALLPYAAGAARLLFAWLGAEYLVRRHVPALAGHRRAACARSRQRRFERLSVAGGGRAARAGRARSTLPPRVSKSSSARCETLARDRSAAARARGAGADARVHPRARADGDPLPQRRHHAARCGRARAAAASISPRTGSPACR